MDNDEVLTTEDAQLEKIIDNLKSVNVGGDE